MKLVAGFAALGLLGVAVGLSDWWPAAQEPPWHGYVEAEFVDVAAEETGRLVAVAVERGDAVGAGDPLFRLDAADATAARDEAAARMAAAKAELADLKTGKRPQEIAAIEAQRDAAAATLAAAREELERTSKLRQRGVIAEASLDQARERSDVAAARLAEIEHQLAVAKLPARPERVKAAQHAYKAAAAALARAEVRLARLAPTAPVAARVADVLFRAGELVAAGRPVIRLLPSDGRKVRFFVPEPELAGMALGDQVSVECDGCAEPVEAAVSFVADEAEFTPPVIYSIAARHKLVFLVEARLPPSARLKVGQPVDVRPAGLGEARP